MLARSWLSLDVDQSLWQCLSHTFRPTRPNRKYWNSGATLHTSIFKKFLFQHFKQNKSLVFHQETKKRHPLKDTWGVGSNTTVRWCHGPSQPQPPRPPTGNSKQTGRKWNPNKKWQKQKEGGHEEDKEHGHSAAAAAWYLRTWWDLRRHTGGRSGEGGGGGRLSYLVSSACSHSIVYCWLIY